MRLKLSHHYHAAPDDVGLWTWVRAVKGLELVPELSFLRDYHVTQAGIMAMSAFGGMKEGTQVTTFMHPGSVPKALKQNTGRGWKAPVLDSETAEKQFKLAVLLGLVSQDVFNAVAS